MGAVLSFAGCLDNPDGRSSANQDDTVTLTKAHITPEGELTRVTGLSNGVETSVLVPKVTFERSFVGDGESNILQCYKCICDENVCLCWPVDC